MLVDPLRLRLYSVKKRLSNYNPVDFNLIEAKVMDVGTQQKHNKGAVAKS